MGNTTILPIIPAPQAADMTGNTLTFTATVHIATSEMQNAVSTLVTFARRTHGVHFAIQPASGTVRLIKDATQPPEGYTLTMGAGVTIAAADSVGWQNGVTTLVQLMAPGPDAAHFTVPEGMVTDVPGCSWRGLMVDLARDFHEFPVLLQYVDMCRFYKLRTLHLHFTDDQSYTLPSRAFPKLSTPGRSYTEEQIRELVAYAAERDILLMPEIDVPGHCTSFAEGYGDIFGRDGIIRQSEASMACMEALFRELCGMFPNSPYIHIGGDEAAIDKWTADEPTLAAARARGIDTEAYLSREGGRDELAQLLYATFVRRMAEAVLSCDRTPVVWEGFGASVNHLIPRETVVMSWENFYQTTPSLQEAGFRLLNCSWSPMYVVAPNVHWTPEEVYNWNIYTWHPVHPGSPYLHGGLTIPATEQVEGGQLLAWGDQIMAAFPDDLPAGVRCEQKLLEERIPCLAENTWNREKLSDYADFSTRYARVTALYEAFRVSH